MNFNEEQKRAIVSVQPLVVISAGAGSGKTRVLTERFVHICEQKLLARLGQPAAEELAADASGICAITFTNKAAREMKERIRSRLRAKLREADDWHSDSQVRQTASDYWKQQLEILDGALITTFHSFCNHLLREYAFEADVLPGFSVLDEAQSKLLQSEVADRIWNTAADRKSWSLLSDYYDWNRLPEMMLALYAQLQEQSSITFEEPLFDDEAILKQQKEMVALAKQELWQSFYTRAHHYLQQLPDPRKINGKAGEYVENLAVWWRSCSIETGQADQYLAQLQAVMPASLNAVWKKNDLLASFVSFHQELWKPLKEKWQSLFPTCASEQENRIKAVVSALGSAICAFHQEYARVKREKGVLDFSDLQQKAAELLENPQIKANCRQKYKHFMIDEFQDTNRLQFELINRISPAFRFIVGDGKQSIYRFRGADVSLIQTLSRQAREDEHAEFIDMNMNYRTCASIIQFVNRLFQQLINPQAEYSNLTSHRQGETAWERRVEFLTVSAAGRLKSDETGEEVCPESTAGDAPGEYELLAMRMIEMMEAGQPLVEDSGGWRAPKWRDMAVLIQTRSHLPAIEEALKAKGIPYLVYGGIGFFEKQEVQDLFTLVKWLSRPWEELYLYALLRTPMFGIDLNGFLRIKEAKPPEIPLYRFLYDGRYKDCPELTAEETESLAKLQKLYQRWIPFAPVAGLRDTLLELFSDSGLRLALLMQPGNLQLVKNVEKWIGMADRLHPHSLEELIEQVDRLALLSEKEGEAEVELSEGDVVHILTVHASKGLEFPIVFLPGLNRLPRTESGWIRFDKEAGLRVKFEQSREDLPLEEPEIVKSPAFDLLHAQEQAEALEEQKRLFYVAVTRARDFLVLTSGELPQAGGSHDNTWHKWLVRVMEEDASLQDLIAVRPGYTYEGNWLAGRAAYLGPARRTGKQDPLVFSVSEIMEYVHCPRSFYYKHVLKVDPAWLSGGGPPGELVSSAGRFSFINASQLGTLVHLTCEWLDSGLPLEDAVQEAIRHIGDIDHLEEYRSRLCRLAGAYSQLDVSRWGRPVANEWEFQQQLGEIIVVGQIDKIVLANGRYHVIDIKTNVSADREQLAARYKPQLYLYKWAYETIEQVLVSSMSLLFLQDQGAGLYHIPYEADYERRLFAALEEMAGLQKEDVPAAAYCRSVTTSCKQCVFYLLCKPKMEHE